MFPAEEGAGTVNSVFESMTPRAAVAHEAGHMLTTRAGMDFEAGSVFDEVNASLTMRPRGGGRGQGHAMGLDGRQCPRRAGG